MSRSLFHRHRWIVTGCLLVAGASFMLSYSAQAQSGLILTGSENVPVLKYKLDFGGIRTALERYRLDIPPQDVAVAELQISGEPRFDGTVDPNEVTLEVEGKEIELDKVFWNPEFRSLEVVAKKPIAAGQKMKLILSNTRNPSEAGFYRFVGRLRGTEANPIFRTIGNWIITIDQADRS